MFFVLNDTSVLRLTFEVAWKAFESRWSKMLALAVANLYSASLVLDKSALACQPIADGDAPWLPDLLSTERCLLGGCQQNSVHGVRVEAD